MNPDVKQRRPGDYSVFKIAMGYMGEGGGQRVFKDRKER